MREPRPERRQSGRSVLTPENVPHIATPRPRPRSLRAMIVAVVAGIGITLATSVLGRCDGDPSIGRADSATPAATAAPGR